MTDARRRKWTDLALLGGLALVCIALLAKGGPLLTIPGFLVAGPLLARFGAQRHGQPLQSARLAVGVAGLLLVPVFFFASFLFLMSLEGACTLALARAGAACSPASCSCLIGHGGGGSGCSG